MHCVKRVATLCVCAVVAGLNGCLVVPVPHDRPGEVSPKALEWAVPGVSIRRDFIVKLGDPLFRQRNDSIFIYAADTTAFLWMIGGGCCGEGGAIKKTYFVLVRFTAEGVLEEVRFDDRYTRDPCSETGFCDPIPMMSP